MPTEGNYWTRTGRQVARRRFLAVAGLSGAGAAFTLACSSSNNNSNTAVKPTQGAGGASSAATSRPAGTAAGSTPAAIPAQKGGFLRLDIPPAYSPTVMDPFKVTALVFFITGGGYAFYESLLQPDFTDYAWSARKLVPMLSTSYESPDHLTYNFTLRQGVMFHSGAPLTADDVVYSYQRTNAPDALPSTASYAQQMKVIQAVDAKTVSAVAKAVDVDFIQNFSGYYGVGSKVAIIAKGSAESADLAKTDAGTGPFKLQSLDVGSKLVGVRFDDYWQAGRPYLDGVSFGLGVAPAKESANFIAGETDVIIRQDPLQLKAVQDGVPKAVVNFVYGSYLTVLQLNATKQPLGDQRVRQAMSLALDRQALEKVTTFGKGLFSGPLMNPTPGYTMSEDDLLKQPGYRQPKAQDIADAKKLMAAAGFANGFKISLLYNPNTATAFQSFAEGVQAQLKATLSIDVTLEPLTDAAAFTKRNLSGDYDMQETLIGDDRPGYAIEGKTIDPAGPYAKVLGWQDDQLNALIQKEQTEFDDTARGQIFQQIEKRLLDLNWQIAFTAPPDYGLNQPWINNWRNNLHEITSWVNPSSTWMDLSKAPANRKSG